MSRFLTISHVEGGPTLVRGPQPKKPQASGRRFGDVNWRGAPKAPLVAEFRDGMDAMRFLSAVANSVNNPEARADYLERRQMHVEAQDVHGGQRWRAIYALETVATFAERADADLFVNFMRIG